MHSEGWTTARPRKHNCGNESDPIMAPKIMRTKPSRIHSIEFDLPSSQLHIREFCYRRRNVDHDRANAAGIAFGVTSAGLTGTDCRRPHGARTGGSLRSKQVTRMAALRPAKTPCSTAPRPTGVRARDTAPGKTGRVVMDRRRTVRSSTIAPSSKNEKFSPPAPRKALPVPSHPIAEITASPPAADAPARDRREAGPA